MIDCTSFSEEDLVRRVVIEFGTPDEIEHLESLIATCVLAQGDLRARLDDDYMYEALGLAECIVDRLGYWWGDDNAIHDCDPYAEPA